MQASQQLVTRAGGPDIWITDWQTRRHIFGDEYTFWVGLLGASVISISIQWFDSIPVA